MHCERIRRFLSIYPVLLMSEKLMGEEIVHELSVHAETKTRAPAVEVQHERVHCYDHSLPAAGVKDRAARVPKAGTAGTISQSRITRLLDVVAVRQMTAQVDEADRAHKSFSQAR